MGPRVRAGPLYNFLFYFEDFVAFERRALSRLRPVLKKKAQKDFFVLRQNSPLSPYKLIVLPSFQQDEKGGKGEHRGE